MFFFCARLEPALRSKTCFHTPSLLVKISEYAALHDRIGPADAGQIWRYSGSKQAIGKPMPELPIGS